MSHSVSPLTNPVSRKKALEVFAGTDNAYRLAKRYGIKTAFGTDLLFGTLLKSPLPRGDFWF